MIIPDDQEQLFIHRKIVDDLENGIINPETKQELLTIIMNLIHRALRWDCFGLHRITTDY